MLVGFGQVRCLPVNPKCDECVLSSKGLCPSARASPSKKKTAVGGKKRKVEVEVEEPSEPGLVTAGLEMDGLLKIEEDIGVKMEEAS
jgi:endonuclease-3